MMEYLRPIIPGLVGICGIALIASIIFVLRKTILDGWLEKTV
jgi:hypothetical protein